MKEFYNKFYREEFYVLSDLLPDELVKGQPLFLNTFDYRNRCVNFNAILSQKKQFNSEFPIDGIISFLKGNNFESFKDQILTAFKGKGHDYIRKLTEFASGHQLTDQQKAMLHYWLVELYHAFPDDPNVLINGILKKIIRQLAADHKRFKLATLDIIKEWPYQKAPWVRMTFYDDIKVTPDNAIFIKPDSDIETKEIYASQDTLAVLANSPKGMADQEATSPAIAQMNVSDFWMLHDYLFPLFSKERFTGSDRYQEWAKTNSVSHAEDPLSFLVMPIYSADFHDGDFGTIIAYFFLPFKSPEDRQRFLRNNERSIEKLWYTWTTLTLEALLEGKTHLITKRELRYNDSLMDFLDSVAFVQDWERIMVFTKRETTEPEYCFKRFLGGRDGKRLSYEETWEVCRNGKNAKCRECLNGFENEQLGRLSAEKVWQDKNGRWFFFQDMAEILDSKVLPAITEDDRLKYSDHILCFEFPRDTFIPTDIWTDQGQAVRELGAHYFKKALPILDKVILKRNILTHSTRAAVSAIISRNHSHHIGSHVTPRTTVEKIRERLTELRGTWNLEEQLKALGFMREQLDDYIQRKADFMAEIATDPISSTSNKALFGEIFLPFIQNSLLMDNIAANEGIHYRQGESDALNRLKIRAKIEKEKTAAEEQSEELSCKLKGNCDCNVPYSHLEIPYGSFCNKCGPDYRLNLVSPVEKDIVIALPGQLGEFAIYCFLENLIRNSVKHSPKQLGTDEDVNIFLEVSKFPEGHPYRHDFYSVEIYDTITEPGILINGKPLVDHLINFKNDKIIENDGRLKSGAWGIAEMKIMATLLAGSTDFLTMESNLEICSKKIDGHDRLVYKFRFMRPKQVAVIEEKRPDETIEKGHRDRGIFWFSSVDEYSKEVMSGRSPASFEFLVVPSDQVDAYQQYAHLCPYRVLVVRENNRNSEVATGMVSIPKGEVDRWIKAADPDGIDRIVLGCWRNWVSKLKQRHFSDNKISLGLYLQQEQGLQPTSQYITLAEEHNKSNPNSCFSLITDTKHAEVIPEPKAKPQWLIFDRHFGGWGKLYSSYKRRNDELSFRKDILFHEVFGKSSSDFVSIFSGKPSIDKILALSEAAMLRILVLDERVAEVAHNIIPGFAYADRYGQDGKRIFIAKYAGVFIATHICVNNKPPEPLHESVKDKSPCCCAWVQTSADGSIASVTCHWCETNHSADGGIGPEQRCDALQIHQGVAESRALKDVVTRNGEIDFKKAFAQFIKDASRTIPYVVVHSGRGIPANLPTTSKFMPFSRLEEYIMKGQFAKFSLTQRMMTIIRRKSQ